MSGEGREPVAPGREPPADLPPQPARPRIRRIDDIVKLPPAERARILAELAPADCNRLLHDWPLWARPEQSLPPGDWIVWLILAGRGAGKTRAGAEAVRLWARDYPFVNLIGPTADDARDVMVEGESGVLGLCRKDERPRYLPSTARLEWPNGAVSLVFSAEEPDRLRGKQHMKLWLDELAAWREPDAFDQAMLGLRLGDKPQMVVTTTPRPSKLIRELARASDAIVTRGSTFDNKGNLARAFLERIAKRYEGRTIGRQELFAEILEEAPGALWTRDLIERRRVAPQTVPQALAEIVVGVDPPARSGAKADECGLIVAGKAADGRLYVLADLSSQGDSPAQWAARVGAAYRSFRANRAVAEINNGGDMVAEVMRQAEPNLPVRTVTATRGKFLRAEPVAAAYERGLVFHAGTFPKLEDQMCALTPDFDARAAGFSPDRADALVWALADLMGAERPRAAGMIDFWAGR